MLGVSQSWYTGAQQQQHMSLRAPPKKNNGLETYFQQLRFFFLFVSSWGTCIFDPNIRCYTILHNKSPLRSNSQVWNPHPGQNARNIMILLVIQTLFHRRFVGIFASWHKTYIKSCKIISFMIFSCFFFQYLFRPPSVATCFREERKKSREERNAKEDRTVEGAKGTLT